MNFYASPFLTGTKGNLASMSAVCERRLMKADSRFIIKSINLSQLEARATAQELFHFIRQFE